MCSLRSRSCAAWTSSGPALNPACDGPDPVYAIAMDVGTDDVRDDPVKGNLLYSAVTYPVGSLGAEPGQRRRAGGAWRSRARRSGRTTSTRGRPAKNWSLWRPSQCATRRSGCSQAASAAKGMSSGFPVAAQFVSASARSAAHACGVRAASRVGVPGDRLEAGVPGDGHGLCAQVGTCFAVAVHRARHEVGLHSSAPVNRVLCPALAGRGPGQCGGAGGELGGGARPRLGRASQRAPSVRIQGLLRRSWRRCPLPVASL